MSPSFLRDAAQIVKTFTGPAFIYNILLANASGRVEFNTPDMYLHWSLPSD